jgi:hypothetical protein
MNTSDSRDSDPLVGVAEAYLGRALSEPELRQLRVLFPQPSGPPRETTRGDEARLRNERLIREGREKIDTTVGQVMEGARRAAERAAAGASPEAHALVRRLEEAGSLDDLRPSRLNMQSRAEEPATKIVMTQIADRLANLVKHEVEARFSAQFGPLARQLEAAIRAMPTSGDGAAGGDGSDAPIEGDASGS